MHCDILLELQKIISTDFSTPKGLTYAFENASF